MQASGGASTILIMVASLFAGVFEGITAVLGSLLQFLGPTTGPLVATIFVGLLSIGAREAFQMLRWWIERREKRRGESSER